MVRTPKRDDKVNANYQRFLPSAVVGALSVYVAEPEDIFAVVVRDSFAFHKAVDATAGDDGVLGAYALHFFTRTSRCVSSAG